MVVLDKIGALKLNRHLFSPGDRTKVGGFQQRNYLYIDHRGRLIGDAAAKS